MTTHSLIHKLKFIARQMVEAKSYTTSVSANDHLFHGIDECEKLIETLGEELIKDTVERC